MVATGPALLVTIGVALACAIYNAVSEGGPSLQKTDLKLAYDLVSFALALLLVFKTNTCYARFWEGAPSVSCACVSCRCHDQGLQSLSAFDSICSLNQLHCCAIPLQCCSAAHRNQLPAHPARLDPAAKACRVHVQRGRRGARRSRTAGSSWCGCKIMATTHRCPCASSSCAGSSHCRTS
jgi:Bestrophin, RFP-TM, chloride channel